MIADPAPALSDRARSRGPRDRRAAAAAGDRFAARTGFDTRATPYRWFRISPRRIQAWREVNELPDRELTRDSRWLV